MTTAGRRWLYWTPRALTALFAAFLALFAMDVFDERLGVARTIVALAVHLVPTWIVLAVLAASWRREWIGAAVFPALAAFYVATTWGRFPWPTYAVIAGPLVLVGALFLANWLRRAELRPGDFATRV